MRRLSHSFLLLLASATDRELARHLQYLKAENEVLRSKLPRRIPVTAWERQRLVKLGLAVGSALKELITIVTPRTFLRWINGERRRKRGPRKPGRITRPPAVR